MSSIPQEPVYIIIPVHNRKNTTLKCLDNLQKNGDIQRYHIVVVDDGSADGTAEAIQALYSDITILSGDGNLWWTGAIKQGMEYAYRQNAEYLIWLNDDCYPQANSIQTLISFCRDNPNIIAGGQSVNPENLQPSYGGIISHWHYVEQVNSLGKKSIDCDGLAGNFVCISRQVIDRIGYPNDNLFPHYYGDVTYTNKAKKNGYKLTIIESAIAYCKNEKQPMSWLTTKDSLLVYWREYFQIKSPLYWRAELFFYWQIIGKQGSIVYLYERIVKFWLLFFITKILPLKYRLNLKDMLLVQK